MLPALRIAAVVGLALLAVAGASSARPSLIAAVERETHGSPNTNVVLVSPSGGAPRRLLRTAQLRPPWRAGAAAALAGGRDARVVGRRHAPLRDGRAGGARREALHLLRRRRLRDRRPVGPPD